jgi:hypothetical protein
MHGSTVVGNGSALLIENANVIRDVSAAAAAADGVASIDGLVEEQ